MNPLYRTSPQLVARASVVAVVIGVLVGIAWGFQQGAAFTFPANCDRPIPHYYDIRPTWSFWFAILCGFGIAETMVRVTGAKRGSTYQMTGIIGVLLCVVLSRIIIAHQIGVSLSDILTVLGNSRLGDPLSSCLFSTMALNLPNFVYIGLAVAIPFIRFR